MSLKGSKYKNRDGTERKFYGCNGYPECKGTHGANPDGTPLGVPADGETKALRQALHKMLEIVFGSWDSKENRNQMYGWLKKNAPEAHIGSMSKSQILETISTLVLGSKIKNEKVEELLEHYMGKHYERAGT